MRIARVKIRNFRKLNEVTISLQDNTTVFIGANNTGKTSATIAMSYFLTNSGAKNFNIYDFTLSNHIKIKEIGYRLEGEIITGSGGAVITPRDLSVWKGILPALDIWFDVQDNDIHYVSHILPTLDWSGGELGLRIQFEPGDIGKLYSEYKEAKKHIDEIKAKAKVNGIDCDAGLFPTDFFDFLKKNIQKYFIARFYVLDPTKSSTVQQQEDLGAPLEKNPLIGLIKINEVNAQRPLNEESDKTNPENQRRLSQQITDYYNKHLDPFKEPTEHDIAALDAIYKAQDAFNKSMNKGFEPALEELRGLGYPGVNNPDITINPRVKPTDGLNHDTALQYKLDGCEGYTLPEAYNGLGYQNLIFMTFKLIRFRDSWLKIGKQKNEETSEDVVAYEPIHLVLVEEPEAHLHPQAQQVFIKQAYKLLIVQGEIKKGNLTTQLVITTHSSHITHECEFAQLRYFKRVLPEPGKVQSTEVINVHNMFGNEEETKMFVSRYIKLTHCDLFFADAAILIEGDAERILLPSFISKYDSVNQSYVCLLSIGGSHAHRLRLFMEVLGIPTLIVTDLDSVSSAGSSAVARGVGQKTDNDTLKKWIPCKEDVDELLALPKESKRQDNPFALSVAFQTPIIVSGKEVLPYTFEDSIIFENKDLLDSIKVATGTIKRAQGIKNAQDAFDILKSKSNPFKKAEFALDLLCLPNFGDIRIPVYISEGLDWLEGILSKKMISENLAQEKIEVEDAQ